MFLYNIICYTCIQDFLLTLLHNYLPFLQLSLQNPNIYLELVSYLRKYHKLLWDSFHIYNNLLMRQYMLPEILIYNFFFYLRYYFHEFDELNLLMEKNLSFPHPTTLVFFLILVSQAVVFHIYSEVIFHIVLHILLYLKDLYIFSFLYRLASTHFPHHLFQQ